MPSATREVSREPSSHTDLFFCGKPPPRSIGKRMGTSYECFRRGIAIAGTVKKPHAHSIRDSDPISMIKGIGPQFTERLAKKEGIEIIRDLLKRVHLRNENARSRREFLKKIFKNFSSRKVNRMAFANVRNFLITKGIEVLDMTVANRIIIS